MKTLFDQRIAWMWTIPAIVFALVMARESQLIGPGLGALVILMGAVVGVDDWRRSRRRIKASPSDAGPTPLAHQ